MPTAVIFDMDGVVSDTQKLHAQVESELLGRHGVHIQPEEISRRYAGVNTRAFFSDLLSSKLSSDAIDQLLQEKWLRMAAHAARSIDPIDGAIPLIKRLHGEGILIALASASPSDYVHNVIVTLGLKEYFHFLASGDMVLQRKPNPEIFLLAAAKIGVLPQDAVVIEDGISGMTAAKAAGMKCIGLVASKEILYPTQNLASSLNEITSAYLNNLL